MKPGWLVCKLTPPATLSRQDPAGPRRPSEATPNVVNDKLRFFVRMWARLPLNRFGAKRVQSWYYCHMGTKAIAVASRADEDGAVI
jgi:hypothetical protein